MYCIYIYIYIYMYAELPSMTSKQSFSQGTLHGSRRYSANLSVTYLKQNMVVGLGCSHGYQYSASTITELSSCRVNTGRINIEKQWKHTLVLILSWLQRTKFQKIKIVPEEHNRYHLLRQQAGWWFLQGSKLMEINIATPNMFLHYNASNIHIQKLDDWSILPLNCSKHLLYPARSST